jgi:hypothetical protein
VNINEQVSAAAKLKTYIPQLPGSNLDRIAMYFG